MQATVADPLSTDDRSGLRHDGRSGDVAPSLRARRRHVPFLLRRLPRANSPPTRDRYLAPSERRPAPPGAIYTCPMHPEIRQIGPGSCPICGMALEPLTITAEPRGQSGTRRHDPALLDRPRAHRPGGRAGNGRPCSGHRPASSDRARPRELAAIRPGDARSCSGPAGRSSSAAGTRCVRRSLNMFTLIALGTGAAWLYSVVATIAPGIFPAGFRGADGGVAVYFEAAAVITVLVLLGQVLELRAREQTGGAIRALLNLAPKTARRITADGDGRGDPARPGPARRPAARPARRRRAGRRHGAGGPQRRRRIDGHRRIDAGREAARRPGDRRHGQRHRRAGHARRQRRRRTPCSRASSPWSPRRSARARRSSASPTSWPAGSCRR